MERWARWRSTIVVSAALATAAGLVSCSSGSAGVVVHSTSRATSPAATSGAEPDRTPGTPGSEPHGTEASKTSETTETSETSGTSGTSGRPLPDPGRRLTCPAATVNVHDADGLTAALAGARAGDVIVLAAGTYTGRFVGTTTASAAAPVFVCGPRDAVIDGDGIRGGYAWHLDGATGWRLLRFTVQNAQKGVVVDHGVDDIIEGLLVHDIGDEAIHLRTFSTDNIVRANEVRDTGHRRDKFGEGIYIGSATSNWCTYTSCDPDRSDRNLIEGNTISGTTSESIDLKEGSSNGVVRGNTFDGGTLQGADSWVDAKGNGYLIEDNVGVDSVNDGFQMHHILDGWGTGNVFHGNTATVNGPGHGFAVTNTDGNVIGCDNTVSGAGSGFADVPCTP